MAMFLTPLCCQALLFRLCRVYVFKAEFRAILRVPDRAVEAKIAGLIRPHVAQDRTSTPSSRGLARHANTFPVAHHIVVLSWSSVSAPSLVKLRLIEFPENN